MSSTLKTRTFVIDNNNDVVEQNEETNQNNVNVFEKNNITLTKKISKFEKTNPNYIYFPQFYKKEFKTTVITVIATLIFFVIILGCSIAFTILSNKYWGNVYILLFFIPLCIYFLIWFFISFFRYKMFYDEAKTINFKDQKSVSVNIVKLYRRLKTGYINLNWMCGLVYTLSILAFITLEIICIAFEGWKNYSLPLIIANNPYFYSSLIILLIIVLVFVFHVWTLFSNYIRTCKIDNFYGVSIVSEEEINKLKSRIFKRDLIIFCLLVVFFGWIVWVIFRIIKRKKAKTVVIQ